MFVELSLATVEFPPLPLCYVSPLPTNLFWAWHWWLTALFFHAQNR